MKEAGMPDAREVYEMVTKQKPPEPGALERQQKRQVRSARNKRIGAFTTAAVIGLVAIALIMALRPGRDTSTPATQPPAVDGADAAAVAVATDFVTAYDSFDAEQAISYLADTASVDVIGGTDGVGTQLQDWPLNLSWWKATGYKPMLDGCQVTSASSAGTNVRCTLDYHNFGSDRIGRGPYTGSYFDLTVRDGQIVTVTQYCELSKFSPQMWEPFATWVSRNYPDDAAVMLNPALDNYLLTPASVRLWGQHIDEYVQTTQGR
jgi:hypothetical protein